MNKKMCRSMKSVLSLILAIVMVGGSIPPAGVVSAAAGAAYSSPLNIDELDGKDIDEVVVDKQSLTLEWSKLTGDASYTLYIASGEEGVSTIKEADYTKTQYTVSADWLTPGIEYQVKLYRYDSNGKRISDGTRSFYFFGTGGESILNEAFEITSPKQAIKFLEKQGLTVS